MDLFKEMMVGQVKHIIFFILKLNVDNFNFFIFFIFFVFIFSFFEVGKCA